MTQSQWRVLPNGIVAEYLDEAEFRGLLEKRFAVPPDHLGILIRDGQIVDAFQGGHFATGGIWESLKSLLGGRHAIRFLIVDLKPFVHRAAVDGLTKDGQEVSGELTVEFQVDGKKPADVMGLLAGKSSLSSADVYARLATHVDTRVLEPELQRHPAQELRGNVGLQDRIQAEILREVERLAGDLGLSLRSATLAWARTQEEQLTMRRRSDELEDAAAQLDLERTLRQKQRERQSTVFDVQADLSEASSRANANVELELLLHNNKLRVSDARTTAQRVEELRTLDHDAETARRRRIALRQDQLERASDEAEKRRIEIDLRRMEASYDLERKRSELEFREMELRLARGSQLEDLKVAEAAMELQRKKLDGMQSLEMTKERERHALSSDQKRQAHEAELERLRQEQVGALEKLRVQSNMTPDQLLAIQAGLSPEIARIFSERAKAEGTQANEKEAILREMVAMARQDSSRAATQTGAVVDAAFGRIAELRAGPTLQGNPTQGAGHGSPAGSPVPENCPSCHHAIHLGDRFCKVCGQKLRS